MVARFSVLRRSTSGGGRTVTYRKSIQTKHLLHFNYNPAVWLVDQNPAEDERVRARRMILKSLAKRGD